MRLPDGSTLTFPVTLYWGCRLFLALCVLRLGVTLICYLHGDDLSVLAGACPQAAAGRHQRTALPGAPAYASFEHLLTSAPLGNLTLIQVSPKA